MKLAGPDEYRLMIRNRSLGTQGPDGTTHFVVPATRKNRLELYAVSKGGVDL